MKLHHKLLHPISALVLVVGILLPQLSYADNVRLADKPLVDSTVSDVLPNLMFILDNSGSMAFNYTPDWVADEPNTGIYNKNAIINTQYYNPTIRYTAALNSNGTSRGDQTTWTNVRRDHYNVQSTSTDNLVNNADYFYLVAGEYCTTAALTTCIASTTGDATHTFPAPIRWCNSSANANLTSTPQTDGKCKSVREVSGANNAYDNERLPLSRIVFDISTSGGGTHRISSIKVNGMEILDDEASGNSTNNLASSVGSEIDRCDNSLPSGSNCTIMGNNLVSVSGGRVTFDSPAGTPISAIQFTKTSGVTITSSSTNTRPGSLVYTDIVSTNTSYPEPGKTVAAPDRTDCAANSACTYAQEMTNYANWYTYYRTRMQGMKTSASQAFKAIDERYRVGFITINSPNSYYLPISRFDAGVGAQKDTWYSRLFSAFPNGGTPLRSALSLVGRIYANKAGGSDPVEYACQPNFTLLTTDGYWNGAAGVTVTNDAIGNRDGGSTPVPQFEGNTASNTLADVAKYYYDTDLRTSTFGNCNGALGQNVCGEGANDIGFKSQIMTTLTLGLGIDGTLLFDDAYETQTEGDFADIRAGNKRWPVPAADGPTAIDDLWHAAVNANGTYFSARNPKQLSDSLRRALSDIQSKVGAGSAAAASSLQPTAGDNFDYVASYETVKWIGNLEARVVDLTTLATSETATWCAESIAAESCTAPAQLVARDLGGTNAFYCRTTNATAESCTTLGGDLTDTSCFVSVAPACTGTMRGRITTTTDTRNIKFNSGGSLASFEYNNLSATQKAFYSATFLSTHLSQWPEYTSGTGGQQSLAVGDNLVNYLRGRTGFEDRSSNAAVNRIFRFREAVLGDITESQPAFVGPPRFNYVDAGYSDFKTAQASRLRTVYVGANDGMLHAFDANNGQERWAFVPTPVISKMWKLADKDYATRHVNLVNGDPFIADIFDGTWKTILVAGLSGGGRGYYALDITDPAVPKLLWEKTAEDFSGNLGYGFGVPVVTKLNGTWVVLLSSGYNNGTNDSDNTAYTANSGNGQGYIYVLNANSGALIKTMTTSVGSPTTPSGLAPMAAYVDDLSKNNFAKFVIAGDLLGNVWKFDITSNNAPILIATLKGPTGLAQPITTVPQLGLVNKLEVAFVGTGKYLEVADLTNTEVQSLYALKVSGNTPLNNPRSSMVQQTLTDSGASRTVSDLAVNYTSGLGWFLDFPAMGERVNIDGLLVNGVLLAPSIVPASTSCSPGGLGYFNYFDYTNGGALLLGGVASERVNSPIVGFNVSYDQDGNPRLKIVESSSPTSKLAKNTDVIGNGGATPRTTVLKQNCVGCTFGRKYNWRELVPAQ